MTLSTMPTMFDSSHVQQSKNTAKLPDQLAGCRKIGRWLCLNHGQFLGRRGRHGRTANTATD